jgi:predicted phage tail component-like protein
MRESIDIVYDGIQSTELGGIQISDDSGLFTETFVATKSIREEKIRGRDEPYFFGVEREPISFPLSFYFDEELSDKKKREIARWLDKDYYKPLYSVNDPHRIYYAMCVEDSEHIHNGIEMGYVTLNFRTSSPYAYSPVYFDSYDLSENISNGTEITFVNNGDLECKPVLEIHMLEEGDLSIVNYSHEGLEFKFTDLKKDEVLTVDCSSEEIDSNIDYRFDNFNDNYLSFVRGNNYLKVYGKCIISLQYQFKFR